MDKIWHPNCFACAICEVVLGNNYVVNEETEEETYNNNKKNNQYHNGVKNARIEGQPYCENCDPQKCYGCFGGLGVKRFLAVGELFHPRCFVCHNCRCLLEKKVFVIQGFPSLSFHSKKNSKKTLKTLKKRKRR